MTDELSRKRADARRNRELITEAARATFAAHGLDVPMRAIARRAGVGPATLYRHFPTKEALIAETFAVQMGRCVATLDAALDDPDPWRGFCAVIEKVCATQAVDRGFTAALLDSMTTDFARVRDHNARRFAELTRRAQRSGQLRSDFVPGDLKLLILANGGLDAEPPAAARAASRRLVALLLQSLRAHPTDPPTPLPPPAPLDFRIDVRL
ncbi:TetR/AcrR family transcriptional regulator [Streptomyces botrytidirepellens]|uniref:TetR/AcrR family transcriptional regulator n=1 Tax=Streptomyces botrytidirepellens TaxID=2486417 RepID=A0A3M8VK00_9ACTN|nr:TetR/AcrR family transcriptional regulator [Streptomyces botrytidirepellens]RNG17906.1 TetR/AcrR family transcriptional regulator [Streptomyces botrytidirepellens]